MRKTVSTIILLFVMAIAFAQPKADKLSLSLQDGKLVLNKVQVNKDWKLETLAKVLGSEGRKRPGYNTTHSYDDFGIVLFEKTVEKMPSGDISEFQVYISEMSSGKSEVTPSGLYSGKFEIEKTMIKTGFPLDKLREVLKDYTESNSYMGHSFRFARKGLYMYVQYNENDDRIEKISIGKDNSIDKEKEKEKDKPGNGKDKEKATKSKQGASGQ